MKPSLIKLFGSSVEFETFGKSSLAYVRRVSKSDLDGYLAASDDWEDASQGSPSDAEENSIWGLFGADGEPIAFSHEEEFLSQNAAERDLLTVRVQ